MVAVSATPTSRASLGRPLAAARLCALQRIAGKAIGTQQMQKKSLAPAGGACRCGLSH